MAIECRKHLAQDPLGGIRVELPQSLPLCRRICLASKRIASVEQQSDQAVKTNDGTGCQCAPCGLVQSSAGEEQRAGGEHHPRAGEEQREYARAPAMDGARHGAWVFRMVGRPTRRDENNCARGAILYRSVESSLSPYYKQPSSSSNKTQNNRPIGTLQESMLSSRPPPRGNHESWAHKSRRRARNCLDLHAKHHGHLSVLVPARVGATGANSCEPWDEIAD